MVSVFDAAAYIVEKTGEMTTLKLQKLVYYAQAWSLVWDERPLFDEKIEAWSNGPVARDLFEYHRGKYFVSAIEAGDPGKLDEDQKATVNMVLKHYGDKPAYWLVRLSHSEPPWIEARGDLSPAESSDAEITLDSMAQYYSSLLEIDIESWKATAEEMADADKDEILTESKRKIEADEVIPWEEVKQEFDIRLR